MGTVLTANITGLPSGTTPDFRWERASGEVFAAIPDALAGTYRVTAEDNGFRIRALVSNPYFSDPISSEPTGTLTYRSVEVIPAARGTCGMLL